ncbi:hypothetical protein MMC07_007520 [Pseudocyphellaria aurata]|nr:hypothetical protein [Pseudocyphellaria aurata]
MDEQQRARDEALSRRTSAVRMQYELYALHSFHAGEQEEDCNFDEPMSANPPPGGKDVVVNLDDTSSMSSGMNWFLETPSRSEYGDDDAASVSSLGEPENDDEPVDEPVVGKETCHFMKMPPEIRCLIYGFCLPPKGNKALICMWPTMHRDQDFSTPVSHEEPTDDQLPSFSSNLQSYGLTGPRAAPIQREPDFVGQTILAVNRLIYAEASRDFYRSHTFRFNSRQIETQDIYSGVIPRLCHIEVEDAVFRFGLRSTEMKLLRMSRSRNLKQVVIGPRTAESMFSGIRWVRRLVKPDLYGKKSHEITPYAAKLYNDEYFTLYSWPIYPKVAVVSLNVPALLDVMRLPNTLGPLPTIPAEQLQPGFDFLHDNKYYDYSIGLANIKKKKNAA